MQFKTLKIILALFLSLNLGSIWAQNTLTYTDNESNFRNGLEYIDRRNYYAAKVSFEKYLNNQQNLENQANFDQISAEYYIILCSLNLGAPEADIQAVRFVSKYPNHPKSESLFLNLGDFYFVKENYEKAIYYFGKITANKALSAASAETLFKLGTSYYNMNEPDKSLPYFLEAGTKNSAEYSPKSNYFAGTIYYKNEAYQQAINVFSKIENHVDYAAEAPSWIAHSYKKLDKNEALISYANGKLAKISGKKYEMDLGLLLGNEYFEKNDFVNAEKYYLLAKNSNKKIILPHDVVYRLGFSQFKQKKYDLAIENLQPIALKQDEVGQFASFYLAVCYLNKNNTNGAMAAFNAAKQLNYNKTIKEDAFFNHAKSQFANGNSNATIKEIEEFLKQFPNSSYETEAIDLQSEAFLNSNNYQQAITHIESLKKRSPKTNGIYQKMTYNQGISDFNNENYAKAIVNLEKAIATDIDTDTKWAAEFYKAESYYHQKNFGLALPIYNVIIDNKNNAWVTKSYYSVGYIYFSQKNFEKSAENFKNYTNIIKNQKDKQNYNDAMARLADSYFAVKNFAQAGQIYDLLVLNGDAEKDYAMFQKGQSLQYQGKDAQAKDIFQKMLKEYPNSPYADDALYKTGEIMMNEGSLAASVPLFTKLINSKSNSYWSPKGLIKRAIVYSNLKDFNASIEDYRRFLKQYPGHEDSESALLGLQDALSQSGRSDEFSEDLAFYKNQNPTSGSTEAIEYDNAKSLYTSQQYAKSIIALNNYIKSHPGSGNSIEAQFFVAESYYKLNDKTNALVYYYKVLSYTTYKNYNKAHAKALEIELANNNYGKGITLIKNNLPMAQTKNEANLMQFSIANLYFKNKQLDSAMYFCNEILLANTDQVDLKNNTNLLVGKIYFEKNEFKRAQLDFNQLAKTDKTEIGAEAKYYNALCAFKLKNYKESIEICKGLNTDFSEFENWRGKGFLLIADNYIGLNDSFNAKAVLISIIDNATDAELVNQAKNRLSTLK